MKTVYVVGYEGKDILATSGWDWYPNKNDADRRYDELKEKLGSTGAAIYRGELYVLADIVDFITDEVEKFLEENDWENAFKNKAEAA